VAVTVGRGMKLGRFMNFLAAKRDLARVYGVTAKNSGNVSIGQQLAAIGVYDLRCCGLEALQIEDLNQLSLGATFGCN